MPSCIECGAPAAILDPRRGEPVCLLHAAPRDDRGRERMESVLRALDPAGADGEGAESGPARCLNCQEFVLAPGELFCCLTCRDAWQERAQTRE